MAGAERMLGCPRRRKLPARAGPPRQCFTGWTGRPTPRPIRRSARASRPTCGDRRGSCGRWTACWPRGGTRPQRHPAGGEQGGRLSSDGPHRRVLHGQPPIVRPTTVPGCAPSTGSAKMRAEDKRRVVLLRAECHEIWRSPPRGTRPPGPVRQCLATGTLHAPEVPGHAPERSLGRRFRTSAGKQDRPPGPGPRNLRRPPAAKLGRETDSGRASQRRHPRPAQPRRIASK